jgi:hypothetical protein
MIRWLVVLRSAKRDPAMDPFPNISSQGWPLCCRSGVVSAVGYRDDELWRDGGLRRSFPPRSWLHKLATTKTGRNLCRDVLGLLGLNVPGGLTLCADAMAAAASGCPTGLEDEVERAWFCAGSWCTASAHCHISYMPAILIIKSHSQQQYVNNTLFVLAEIASIHYHPTPPAYPPPHPCLTLVHPLGIDAPMKHVHNRSTWALPYGSITCYCGQ